MVIIGMRYLQSGTFLQIRQEPVIRPLTEKSLSDKQQGNDGKSRAAGIPHPVPVEQRIEPLPWQFVNLVIEDVTGEG